MTFLLELGTLALWLSVNYAYNTLSLKKTVLKNAMCKVVKRLILILKIASNGY